MDTLCCDRLPYQSNISKSSLCYETFKLS